VTPPGSLAVACEASFLRAASSCFCWPAVLSAVLPVREPRADWAAPVMESMVDWRVEVFLSDMIVVLFVSIVL